MPPGALGRKNRAYKVRGWSPLGTGLCNREELEQLAFLGDISGEAQPRLICDIDSVLQVPHSCWEAGTDLRAQMPGVMCARGFPGKVWQ